MTNVSYVCWNIATMSALAALEAKSEHRVTAGGISAMC